MLLDIVALGTNKVEEIGHLDQNGLVGRASELAALAVVVHITQTIVVATLQKDMTNRGREFQAKTSSNTVVYLAVGVFAILIDHAIGTLGGVPCSTRVSAK